MSMIHFADADKHLRFMCLNVCLAQCLNRFLFVKVLEVTSNKEKAIVSIVKFTFATFSDQAALILAIREYEISTFQDVQFVWCRPRQHLYLHRAFSIVIKF